jgi:hypothetical protein
MEGAVTRVRYRFQRGALSRETTPWLDGGGQPGRDAAFELLSSLKDFDVEILDANGRPVADGVWPVRDGQAPTILPRALKVKLDTVTWGSLERTLLIGG